MNIIGFGFAPGLGNRMDDWSELNLKLPLALRDIRDTLLEIKFTSWEIVVPNFPAVVSELPFVFQFCTVCAFNEPLLKIAAREKSKIVLFFMIDFLKMIKKVSVCIADAHLYFVFAKRDSVGDLYYSDRHH